MRFGAQVLLAIVVLNLGTYIFQLAAAQILGPADFGTLSALLSLLNLIGLPLGAVQVGVARHVAELKASGRGDEAPGAARTYLVASAWASLGLCAVYAALLLPLQWALGLDELAPLALLGLAIPGSLILPVLLGVLQGEQRFRDYSVALAATGALRPGIFGLLAAYGYRLSGAVIATVGGGAVGFALAAKAARDRIGSVPARLAELREPALLLAPIAVGVLGVTALTNIDLLVAKAALGDDEAGIFGAGAFVGRAILYLPTAMIAILFPKVAARRAQGIETGDILGRSVIVLLGFSAVFTAILFAIPGPILRVAFGSEYAAGAGELGLFGIGASLFSLLNVYVNYDLSRGEQRFAYELLALGAVQIAALAAFHDSIREILLVDIAVALLGVVWYEVRGGGALPAIRTAGLHWRSRVTPVDAEPDSASALRAALSALWRMVAARARAIGRRLAVPALLTGIYGSLTLALTWPVPAKLSSAYFGFGNDNLGGIWNFWWWDYAAKNDLDPSRSPFLSAPFGLDLSALPVQPWERWLGQWLTGAFGEVAAYNIIVLSSFPLAGLTMYLLASYLLKDRLAAALAGGIFAFAPFHIGMAMNYPALSSVQWVPLALLFLCRALFERRLRDVAGFVIVFGLLTITSYYYAYYGLVVMAVVAAVYGLRRRRRIAAVLRARRARAATRRTRALTGLIALASLGLVAFVVAKPLQLYADNRELFERPLSDGVRYSARPFAWLTPGIDHPVFADNVAGVYAAHLHDAPSHEQALYLGYVPLALVLLAALLAIRVPAIRRPLGIAALVGGTGLVIALGPYLPLASGYYQGWADTSEITKIPLPSRLLFEIAPTFRFFSRAQVYVVVGLALAAACAITVLRRRWPGARTGLVVVLVAGLIGFEYANRPPARVVEIGPTPPAYQWLKDQPESFSVAEYPMEGAAAPRTFYYMTWSRVHEKPLVNWPGDARSVAFLAVVGDITSPDAGPALAEAGVRYAIVHTRLPARTYPPYQPGLPDDSLPRDLLADYPHLRLEKRFPEADVYRVLRTPAPSTRIASPIAFGAGFFPPEGDPADPFRWMGPTGQMQVFSFLPPGAPAVLELTLNSFGEPRTVVISGNGVELRRLRVGTEPITVRVPLTLPDGALQLGLSAAPGPTSPAVLLGSADARLLSIGVQGARIVRRR